MAKNKITVDIESLWATWTKGRVTGTKIAGKTGLYPYERDLCETEMHKDIADVIGIDVYQSLLESFGSDIDLKKIVNWDE